MKTFKFLSAAAVAAVFTLPAYAAGSEAAKTIESLPQSGQIRLQGTVTDVGMMGGFTLEDANGETIDIDPKNEVTVNEGDQVVVVGMVDDDFLTGKDINADQVKVHSRAGTTGNQGQMPDANQMRDNQSEQEYDSMQ